MGLVSPVTFDPSNLTDYPNKQGDITISSLFDGTILIINDTIYTLRLDFDDGRVRHVPATSPRSFQLCKNANIHWSIEATMAVANPSASIVIVEAQESSGAFPSELAGLGPLPRIFNIGNAVPVGTSGTSVTNTGNAAGTPFVQGASNALSSGWNVNIDNDGTAYFSVLSNGVYVTVFSITPGTATTPAVTTLINQQKINSDGGQLTSDGSGNLTAVAFHGPADTANQLNRMLQVKNTGGGSANKFVLYTNQSGSITYDFYVGTWDGSAEHDSLIQDHLGLRYADYQVSYDGGLATQRNVRHFEGTVDPTTYITVNEGDVWDDG